MKSIILVRAVPVGEINPPANNPRIPRPVFDPVPPPRFGVTNSN